MSGSVRAMCWTGREVAAVSRRSRGRDEGGGRQARPNGAPSGPRRPDPLGGSCSPASGLRTSRASEEQLSELDQRCKERRRPDPLPQRERMRDLRDDWAAFLGEFDLDVVFTLTFSDEYAEAHLLYCPTSALNSFERFLHDIGHIGQYLVCAEPHFDRDVPHLHGLMQSMGLPLNNLWREWFRTRGRGRFEPPRSDASRYYCTKYALKERDPDVIRFRLSRPTRRRGGRR